MDEQTLKALEQLRSDIISALTRIETQITALEYAVLDEKLPLTPERLKQLQKSIEADSPLQRDIRTYLERTIRGIPSA